MRELHDIFPDPDIVVSFEPEELAGKILHLIWKRVVNSQTSSFHVGNLIGEVGFQDISRGIEGYSRERVGEVQVAVAEALAWLEGQGMIVPTTVSNTMPGMKTLSRRAMKLKSTADFEQHVMARRLNRDLLHPKIAEDAWLNFIRGKYATAVFEAMRAVEIAVRDAGGFSQREYGVDLMRKAFKPDPPGPLTDDEQVPAERSALMDLFAGAIGSYKNPHSHRAVPMDDAGEAMEIVMLASHLLRIVDSRLTTKSSS